MTTTTERRITTADEPFAMPDDGYRNELHRGELRKMPSAADGDFCGLMSRVDTLGNATALFLHPPLLNTD